MINVTDTEVDILLYIRTYKSQRESAFCSFSITHISGSKKMPEAHMALEIQRESWMNNQIPQRY